MIKKISIKNYKSIVDDEIELGRVNVFIGENGAGKSNILEAVAMFSAAKGLDLSIEGLENRGVRITKPNLMFNSFEDKPSESILIKLLGEALNGQLTEYESDLKPSESDDIFTTWKDKENEEFLKNFMKPIANGVESKFRIEMNDMLSKASPNDKPWLQEQFDKGIGAVYERLHNQALEGRKNIIDDFANFNITPYIIYTLSTPALRGITKTSLKQPLGLNGENLDILLSTFDEEEWQLLRDYSHFISWLDDVFVDNQDRLKFEGHKLGRSTSTLYFVDQFMRKNNNIFAAENANEGALYVLFYLALFISKKTPSFFAIDNIETALNPKICRALIESITELAEKTGKQVLITTHNPAVLDGIDLNNDNERLFVVSRNNEGHTKTKRIQFKPQNGQSKYKLSELWMRGKLGGIPQNFL